jgi:hypothetical protein
VTKRAPTGLELVGTFTVATILAAAAYAMLAGWLGWTLTNQSLLTVAAAAGFFFTLGWVAWKQR